MEHYKEATIADSTITIKHVKSWYPNHIAQTRYYGGHESFVVLHANYGHHKDCCV